jgi:hypothetical protein
MYKLKAPGKAILDGSVLDKTKRILVKELEDKPLESFC